MLRRKGQSTLEYALIITVVSAALLAMNYYMKKGVQGKLKENTDQVGKQFEPTTFTNAWETKTQSGQTITNEARTTGGNTTTTISTAETIQKAETEKFGSAPTSHAIP